VPLAIAANTLGRSPRFRWFLLRCARVAGRVRQSFQGGLPKLLLIYLVASALVVLYHETTTAGVAARAQWFRSHLWQPFVSPLLFQSLRWFFAGSKGPAVQAIALAAVLLSTLGVLKLRKQIVILPFTDLSGEPDLKPLIDGLNRRLKTQLSEIADIYEDVSDEPSDLTLYGVEKLELAVDPAGDAFSNLTASLKDQTVQIWFLTIPLGGAATALSTLLKGPQITGSFQSGSQGLLLEASLSGAQYDLSWRVSESDVSPDRAGSDESVAIANRMISQLGHRIFTDLNCDEIGTREWRASEYYTEGLRYFRKAKRSNGAERKIAQQRSEQQFLQAYQRDKRFFRSRYNLGVIYYSRNEPQAALAVFEEVINDTGGIAAAGLPGDTRFTRERSDLAAAHYVAAVAARGSNKESAAKYHADQTLALVPWHAPAAHLKAQLSEMPDALRLLRRACASSWWSLCRAVWNGNVRTIDQWQALLNLEELAKTLAKSGDPKAGIRAMHQAATLDPEIAERWQWLGQLHFNLHSFADALGCFQAANRESETAVSWLWIARLNQAMKRPLEAEDAWARMLDVADASIQTGRVSARNATVPEQNGVLAQNGDSAQSNDLYAAEKLLDDLCEQLASAKFDDATAWTERAEQWIAQRRKILSVRRALLEEAWLEAKVRLDDVLKSKGQLLTSMNEDYSRPEVRYLCSAALRRDEDIPDSNSTDVATKTVIAKLVAKSMEDRPLAALNRMNLANFYLSCSLTDLAKSEISNSLSLAPDSTESMIRLAKSCLNQFQRVTDKTLRRRALIEICRIYRQMAEAREQASPLSPLDVGEIYWFLGTVSFELLDYKTAQQSFWTAYSCGYQPLDAQQWLCLVYFRCGSLEEASRSYGLANDVFRRIEEPTVDDRRTLALAANHTAAALAEHGLVEKARSLWQAGVDMGKDAETDPSLSPLKPAQDLCEGAILLAEGTDLTSPLTVRERREKLKEAIGKLRDAIGSMRDQTVRADGLFRIALACEELARIDRENSANWLRHARESLRQAETADRRDEYAVRIKMALARLEPTAPTPNGVTNTTLAQPSKPDQAVTQQE
jgi:tetratricopeptide (TPR) repeat protein